MLPPGNSLLIFDSNIRPVSPQNGDARLLSFKISDFRFFSEESLVKDKKEVNKITTDSNFNDGLIAQTVIQPFQLTAHPIPSPLHRFGSGWSSDEVTHRWSDSSFAEIFIINNDNRPRSYTIEFKITALTPRLIELSIGSNNLGKVNIETLFRKIQYKRSEVILPPGETILSFHSETLPIRPNNGDDRKLSFQISDLNISHD